MRSLILATALISSVSGYAVAADAVEDVVVVTDEAYNWSGVYVGVQAGYGWGSSDYSIPEWSNDVDTEGFVGGLTVGANWQNGAFVYGVEADISYSDVDGSFSGPNSGFIPCSDEGCTTEIEWFGTGRARLGYAIDNFLPYITGGLAFGQLEGVADDVDGCGPVCSYDETEFGWTVGAGLEWGLTQQISVKAEYLHMEFGSPDFDGNVGGLVSVDDITLDTVRIGLNYRFGP